MTAYLKRGDRIHLAFPISPTLWGTALDDAVKDALHSLIEGYAAQGVTVVTYSASSSITHPTVVAVFRDEPSEEN